MIAMGMPLNETEISEFFEVFLENCSNTMLRQTIRHNPEPEAVEAAKRVIAYRKQDNAQLRQWRAGDKA